MSNYNCKARHPETLKAETAYWIDNYFGSHKYGVKFSDGKVFRESEVEKLFTEIEEPKYSFIGKVDIDSKDKIKKEKK